jgi:hypothetical protein
LLTLRPAMTGILSNPTSCGGTSPPVCAECGRQGIERQAESQ